MVAIGKGGYVPFLALALWVDDLTTALVLYLVPAFFGGFYLAPTFSLIQSLVSLRMRALASSITLFVLNIIGMGFGPQLVGILSDYFAPEYGQHSLRMALIVLSFLNLWCAYHYFTAGRTLAKQTCRRSPQVQSRDYAMPSAEHGEIVAMMAGGLGLEDLSDPQQRAVFESTAIPADRMIRSGS